MRTSEIAQSIGKGLVAGLAGTAAMTASSMLEAKLRKREDSMVPAEAVEQVLDIEPADEQAERRLNNLTHWAYGTGWGSARGVIDAAGLRGPAAPVAHFAAVWGAEQVVLPKTGASPPAWKWSRDEVAIDALHHAVYAAATDLAYRWLERH